MSHKISSKDNSNYSKPLPPYTPRRANTDQTWYNERESRYYSQYAVEFDPADDIRPSTANSRSEAGWVTPPPALGVDRKFTFDEKGDKPPTPLLPFKFGRVYQDDTYSNHNQSREQLQVRSVSLKSKTKKLAYTWMLALVVVVLSVFCTVYAYKILVSTDEIPDALMLTPTNTVLVVNIISQALVFLSGNLLIDVMEALRWALACRESGLQITSFLALSRATAFTGVSFLLLAKGKHHFWCIQRLAFFIICFVFGVVLIANIEFKNVFTYSLKNSIEIQAGLAKLNPIFLAFTPSWLVSLYALTWTTGIMTDPKFVTGVTPIGCSGDNCTSLFLPGSLYLVRKDGSDRNATLFRDDFLNDGTHSAIVIHNAPGYQVEFSSLDQNGAFKPEDCVLHGQDAIQDLGLYVCLASRGDSMIAGWSVCPDEFSEKFQCMTNTSWKTPLQDTTTVSIYKRYATVSYDIANLSIMSVESITDPVSEKIEPSAFVNFFESLAKPIPENVTVENKLFAEAAASYATQMGLGFVMRLFHSKFSASRQSPTSILRSFLIVPIQFSTTMWQAASFSTLPADLKVRASLAKSSYRAVSDAWNVFVFGGLTGIFCIWVLACLIWVTIWGPNSPNNSLYPEIDISSKCNAQGTLASARDIEDLENLTRQYGLGNGESWKVLKSIEGKRIYCGSSSALNAGGEVVAIVTEAGQVDPLRRKEKYA